MSRLEQRKGGVHGSVLAEMNWSPGLYLHTQWFVQHERGETDDLKLQVWHGNLSVRPTEPSWVHLATVFLIPCRIWVHSACRAKKFWWTSLYTAEIWHCVKLWLGALLQSSCSSKVQGFVHGLMAQFFFLLRHSLLLSVLFENFDLDPLWFSVLHKSLPCFHDDGLIKAERYDHLMFNVTIRLSDASQISESL